MACYGTEHTSKAATRRSQNPNGPHERRDSGSRTAHHAGRSGPQTLERFQNDWSASGPPREAKFRSAHFAVDRAGQIAQYRPLDEAAAHIDAPWATSYVGIEHIARFNPREALTDPQIIASATLLMRPEGWLGLADFRASAAQARPV